MVEKMTLVERDDWKIVETDIGVRVCEKRDGRWIVTRYAVTT